MIRNKDKLGRKITDLANMVRGDDVKKIFDSTNKQIVQAYAKLLCSVNHGELRNSIKTSIEMTQDHIRAETFTNKKHAPYVEFGTGPVGEANHEGISPEFTPSYSQHGWGIPADKVDPADAEMYKWPKRTYNGKEYYMTSGQPAQPFLYPALKNNEGKVKKALAKKLVKKIHKEAKK